MFVGEVEEEDIVGLTINGFLYGVRLVGDKSGKYAKMPHSSDNIIPVSFFQIKMGFFGKQKNCFELPVLQRISKFTENVFDNDLAVDV